MSAKITKAEQAVVRTLARLTNARAEDKDRQRRDDTKRKVLLGAALEEMMRRDPTLRSRVKSFVGDFLIRPRDVAVFGLREPGGYFDTLGDTDAVVTRPKSRGRAASASMANGERASNEVVSAPSSLSSSRSVPSA